MRTPYSLHSPLPFGLALLAGLLGAAPAVQAQTTVARAGLTPAANARAAARSTTVVLPFSQSIDGTTAGNIRVFSQQYRGRRMATASTSGSTVTLTPTVPATGSPVAGFKPGETVMVTVPATVQSTGHVAVTPHVYQFTAATTGGGGGFVASTSNGRSLAGMQNLAAPLLTPGDIDGDGDLDLVHTGYMPRPGYQGGVGIMLNSGMGTYTSGTALPILNNPPGFNYGDANTTQLGDVDGDGDLDLLVAYSGTIGVYPNGGDATGSNTGVFGYASGTYTGLPYGALGLITLGDVDGDGDLDLLVPDGSTVAVRLNGGDATGSSTGLFSAGSDVTLSAAVTAIALGDVDGDGDLDLTAAVGSTVAVRLNGGDATGSNTGAFSTGSDVLLSAAATSVALGDLDGDNDLDLAVAIGSTVAVRLNGGDATGSSTGAFSAGSDVPLSATTTAIALGDMDGDSDLDLTVVVGTAVVVRLNGGDATGSGTGNFVGGSSTSITSITSISNSLMLGDVDGDDDLDVLVPYALIRVNILKNSPPPAPAISSFTPGNGPVGTSVVITGTGFTAGMTVSFNGTAAIYTLSSPTQLTATVPSGATTGPISLTNTGGTGTSTSSFTVGVPLAVTASSTNLSCTSQPDGTATATVSGGQTPYTYSWSTSPVQTTATATGLPPGTYTVTVTDAASAQASSSVAITSSDATAPVVLARNVTVTLDASGAATITAAQADNGSTDNCGIATRSLSRSTFGCADANPAALPAVRRGTLLLDRTNNQYVLSNVNVSGATTGTLETWIKTTVANPMYSGIMLTSQVGADGGSGSSIILRWNGGGRVACEGAWAVAQTGTSPALNDGQWHHVAAVGESGTCKLYIDGVLNATGTAGIGGTFSRRIMLGAEHSRTGGYFGTMELDNSRVWSVARTPAQLLDGMANETLANTVGLELAYTYDNGPGTTVSDASGNNRPATLYSATGGALPTWTATGGVPLLPRGVPVTLTVADAAGNSSTASTYVTVLAPALPATALSLSNTVVTENAPVGTVVGTLSLANPGPCASTTTTFELVNAAGTDYAKFNLGTGASANQLLLAAVPDYETQASYTLRLRVTDQNYATVDRTFTITVTDLIELSGTQTTTCGSTGASATVAVAGTATGYAYSWNTSLVQTTATATGLPPGTYTVTVSKTGLTTATRSFTILSDVLAPVAVAKNVTVTLDASGAATLTGAAVDNGSTDNCSITQRTISPGNFSCADANPPVLPANRKGSLRLDRTASQYVLSNATISGTTTGTFETWVKTTTINPVYSGIMVTSGPDAGSGNSLVLRWDGTGRVACDGVWAVAQTGASAALTNGQWHHVAVVGDGTTSKLYIDGVLNNTGTVGAGQTYNRRLMLGSEYQRTPGYFGTMELDNSRVWSVARTPAQLLDGMTYEQLTDATGLVLEYAYDNGTGSAVSDVSGNNRPATLYPAGNLPTWTTTGGVPLVPRGVPVTLTVTDAAGNSSTALAYVTVQQLAGTSSATLTWTGNNSTDWADCGNWSPTLAPDANTTSISIPAGRPRYPALTASSLTVASLGIAAGAGLSQGSTTLFVTGNLTNAGPALTGSVSLTGTGAQTVAGAFGTLFVNKANGSTILSADASVATALTLTSGSLSTGSYALTLAPTATLTEGSTSYVTGTVQTTRDLSVAGTASTFGGLGLTLLPAASSTALPGSTLVRRVTGSPVTGVSSQQSIARYFDIQPTVDANLDVTLTMGYRDSELNGLTEASLALFKSETGAAGSWVRQPLATVNTTANTATLAGVQSLSVWTLGNSGTPLPVELTTFTAQAEGPAARLRWTTASEKNSARFDIERSVDGQQFTHLGEVAAQGTTTHPSAYTYLDSQVPKNFQATLYYRLRQVDLDGMTSYSPVRVVTWNAAAELALFPNPTAGQATLTGVVPGTRVQVLDALGRMVTTATADATGQAVLVLPVGNGTGVYVVHAGSKALRLVVK